LSIGGYFSNSEAGVGKIATGVFFCSAFGAGAARGKLKHLERFNLLRRRVLPYVAAAVAGSSIA
jgi:hypothetical protein